MEFRPCIDIHNGKVKQIVGSSLRDAGDEAAENFVSQADGAFYGSFYKKDRLKGGHVILLNPSASEYYPETKRQAKLALSAYPGGLQAGGGINPINAGEFLDAGASHVIVTSYVFKDGRINYENLNRMKNAVGKEHLVLDVSCRRREGCYYVVTDRWQKFTEVAVTERLLDELSSYADEFLIHAVDVEGQQKGLEEELAALLGNWEGIPVTYAGGVASFADLARLKELGRNRLNVTIGSALSLFGGAMDYKKVLEFCRGERETC